MDLGKCTSLGVFSTVPVLKYQLPKGAALLKQEWFAYIRVVGYMDKLEDLKTKLQAFADERDWDQFHSPKNLSMALSVEASELVECFQWLTEEQSQNLSPEQRQAVIDEMADVQIYLLRLATKLDINLLDAAEQKINKNEAKYPAELVKGSSKKYTEYVKEEQQESQKDETPAGKKG